MEKERVKVLIADDHQIVVDGLVALLEKKQETIEIVAKVNDGVEVIEYLKENPVDIAVLDISMQRMDGAEATQIIRDSFPKTKVLILSMHFTEDYIDALLDAGCSGYVLKDKGHKELITAIERIADGGEYYGPTIFKKILEWRRNAKRSSLELPPQITDREKDVLKLIAKGLTAPQISKELSITENTVNTHSRNMRNKLGIKNVNGLVRYAMESGIAE